MQEEVKNNMLKSKKTTNKNKSISKARNNFKAENPASIMKGLGWDKGLEKINRNVVPDSIGGVYVSKGTPPLATRTVGVPKIIKNMKPSTAEKIETGIVTASGFSSISGGIAGLGLNVDYMLGSRKKEKQAVANMAKTKPKKPKKPNPFKQIKDKTLKGIGDLEKSFKPKF